MYAEAKNIFMAGNDKLWTCSQCNRPMYSVAKLKKKYLLPGLQLGCHRRRQTEVKKAQTAASSLASPRSSNNG